MLGPFALPVERATQHARVNRIALCEGVGRWPAKVSCMPLLECAAAPGHCHSRLSPLHVLQRLHSHHSVRARHRCCRTPPTALPPPCCAQAATTAPGHKRHSPCTCYSPHPGKRGSVAGCGGLATGLLPTLPRPARGDSPSGAASTPSASRPADTCCRRTGSPTAVARGGGLVLLHRTVTRRRCGGPCSIVCACARAAAR
jgi:hypothetical protein